MVVEGILKWLRIAADILGVGLLQDTTTGHKTSSTHSASMTLRYFASSILQGHSPCWYERDERAGDSIHMCSAASYSQEAGVCDDIINLPWGDACLVQKILNGCEASGAKLKARGLNAQLRCVSRLDCWADVALVTQTCAVRNLLLHGPRWAGQHAQDRRMSMLVEG